MKHIINIQEQYGVELHSTIRADLINLEPFVEKILSAVTKGRFLPREHTAGDLPIVQCDTIGNVLQQLAAG